MSKVYVLFLYLFTGGSPEIQTVDVFAEKADCESYGELIVTNSVNESMKLAQHGTIAYECRITSGKTFSYEEPD